MECGPVNCRLAGWKSLSASERKRQRKERAEVLYRQGFTLDAIAAEFGVSQKTISQDLRDIIPLVYCRGTDTLGRRRNQGRRRGSGSTVSGRRRTEGLTVEVERSIASAALDEGKSLEVAASEAGVGVQQAKIAVAYERGRREAEPVITPDMLSMSAQQKLEAAIRQYKRKLDSDFEREVQIKFREAVSEFLPELHRREKKAKQIMDSHRGVMPRSLFRKVLACLESSQRRGVSDRMMDETFRAIKQLEDVLVARETPLPSMGIPSTATDWDELRRRRTEERRARRTRSNVGATL